MIGNPNGSLEEKLLWMRHKQKVLREQKELERLASRLGKVRKAKALEVAQRIQAILDARERKRA